MASEHAGKASQAEFDVLQNRIALALAKRESLVKSWNTSSRADEPTKTIEELDAEDALHFRREPPNLGVGAPIPSHFLVSEAQQNNKSLRAKFFPLKGLQASKARDAEEKAASAKRAKRDQSSDEEEGRSALGRAKKQKTDRHVAVPSRDNLHPERVKTTPGGEGEEQFVKGSSNKSATSKEKVSDSGTHNEQVDSDKLQSTSSATEYTASKQDQNKLSTTESQPISRESLSRESEGSEASGDNLQSTTAGSIKSRAAQTPPIKKIDEAEAKRIRDRQKKKKKRERKRQKEALQKAVQN